MKSEVGVGARPNKKTRLSILKYSAECIKIVNLLILTRSDMPTNKAFSESIGKRLYVVVC